MESDSFNQQRLGLDLGVAISFEIQFYSHKSKRDAAKSLSEVAISHQIKLKSDEAEDRPNS